MKSIVDVLPEVLAYLPDDVNVGPVLDAIIDTVIEICKEVPIFTRADIQDDCEPLPEEEGVEYFRGVLKGQRVVVMIPNRSDCHIPGFLYTLWLEMLIFGTLKRAYAKPWTTYANLEQSEFYRLKFKFELNKFIHNVTVSQR